MRIKRDKKESLWFFTPEGPSASINEGFLSKKTPTHPLKSRMFGRDEIEVWGKSGRAESPP